MVTKAHDQRNLVFFYHKNHNDKFNGTSVYDNALLDILSNAFNIKTIEPEDTGLEDTSVNGINPHYFVNLTKNVYFRQLHWLFDIFKGKHLTPAENTILLVEDVYSGPIPYIVSKLKGYKLVFRAADFGDSYSRTLFAGHPLERMLYSGLRRLIESLLVKRAAVIICPSLSVENAIRTRFPKLEDKFVQLPYIRKMTKNVASKPKETRMGTDELKSPVVLFLGDCRYPPNFEAAHYILNELVPKLNGFNSSFTLLIAGANTDRHFVSDFPNVKVLGPVDDVDMLLTKAQIGIAPIRTEGGLSMKIVDYLTHGLRVIATPEAANGIVPNDQTRLSEISDFVEAVKEEIIRELQNGHPEREVCEKVRETYMSDKWAENLLRVVDEIVLGSHI